ncbi:hypothetical protein [Chromobacterium haemolyticum]|uniref:hypothetical protein n=1 Tax=Chromobacterium haemolyticum TaxID=394935 RepID=UPI0013191F4C|nr:hypothetical protein [Chromobacterium haemolyticum]BBH12970.1 hypothetical protein CH06BL_22180 [Chromobacterium haemolyticum]
MEASQPQKLTYRVSAYGTHARRFDPPANAKALNALWTYMDLHTPGCLMWFCGDSVPPVVRRFPFPSYAHLLAPKPRHMLWSLHDAGHRSRQQQYRSVDLATFAPVAGFFYEIICHCNGNYISTFIFHRNAFIPVSDSFF